MNHGEFKTWIFLGLVVLFTFLFYVLFHFLIIYFQDYSSMIWSPGFKFLGASQELLGYMLVIEAFVLLGVLVVFLIKDVIACYRKRQWEKWARNTW